MKSVNFYVDDHSFNIHYYKQLTENLKKDNDFKAAKSVYFALYLYKKHIVSGKPNNQIPLYFSQKDLNNPSQSKIESYFREEINQTKTCSKAFVICTYLIYLARR
jgi:hypothetical protein